MESASSLLAGSLVAALSWLAIGLAGLIPAGEAALARRVLFPLGAAVGLVLAALGAQAVWLPPSALTLPLGLPDLPFHLRLDPLAGFFLLLLGGVGAGVSVYAGGYFRSESAGRLGLICLQYHVFLAAMAFVILADDAYLFMVAWETMALASYFLVTTDHRVPAIRSAGFLYLLIAHIGAIAILLCFGVLHGGQGDYSFAALRAAELSPESSPSRRRSPIQPCASSSSGCRKRCSSTSRVRSRSATSMPGRATAASSRSTLATARTTTSSGWGFVSSRARGMPTCCW
jgi:hydrogenase-4 component B